MQSNKKYSQPFIAIFILLSFFPTISWSLQLKDFYTMDEDNRTWYLGGIYDANLTYWDDKGIISDCLEKMQFKGFALKLSDFITKLPEEPTSKERLAYDQMNVAGIAWLILQKECA